MADVVNLHAPQMIWVCNCGCSSFSLMSNGDAECAACGTVCDADGQGWFSGIEHAPQRDEGLDAPFADLQGNGSVDFAVARLRALARDEDVKMIVVVKESSRVHVWADAHTPEQADWCGDRLDDALDLIRKGVTP